MSAVPSHNLPSAPTADQSKIPDLESRYAEALACIAELEGGRAQDRSRIAELEAQFAQVLARVAELEANQAQSSERTAQLEGLLAEYREKLAAALAAGDKPDKPNFGPPFSRGEPNPNPKKPGRKRGEGVFKNRSHVSVPQNCDFVDEEAPIRGSTCGHCGGAFEAASFETASTLDIPEVPRPICRRFRVETRRCRCCGRVSRGTHPELAPDQFGATAHRVGRRAYAHAHWLHYGHGLSLRRTCRVLGEMFHLPVSASAIVQNALRAVFGTSGSEAIDRILDGEERDPDRSPIGSIYSALRKAIAQEPVVHTDDTGWRVSGVKAWVMAFCSPSLIVFQIRLRHRNEEVREMLGDRFAGVLVTDRGSSYGSLIIMSWLQQKCQAHIQRNIKAILEFLPADARAVVEELRDTLRQASDLHKRVLKNRGVWTAEWEAERDTLEANLDRLLEPKSHLNPFLDRLLNGLGKQHDCGNLVRFLQDVNIPSTNNFAEQILRFVVIGRKISQCSRTMRGAESYAAWTSLIATLQRTGSGDLLGELLRCLQTGTLPLKGTPAPDPMGLPA